MRKDAEGDDDDRGGESRVVVEEERPLQYRGARVSQYSNFEEESVTYYDAVRHTGRVACLVAWTPIHHSALPSHVHTRIPLVTWHPRCAEFAL